jgi:putative zinc finger/helix-turn-helix YgiT family protein
MVKEWGKKMKTTTNTTTKREQAFCPTCDLWVDYVISTEEVTQRVKENEYTLTTMVPRCIHCQTELFVMDINSQVQQLFFDLYRHDHQLPTVADVIKTRKQLNLNQRDFSRLLGLGEITISRYELGSIPNSSSSILIRNVLEPKMLTNLFENNKDKISDEGQKSIQDYLSKHDTLGYTGNTKFNSKKLYQVIHLFAKLADEHNEKMYPTKMNKLLFYTDFNSYNIRGKSITGSTYLNMNFGPVPQYFDNHYYLNPYIDLIINEEKTLIKAKSMTYESVLAFEEVTICNAIYAYFSNHNSKAISDVSHTEDAWKKTKIGDKIPYEYANQLIHKI